MPAPKAKSSQDTNGKRNERFEEIQKKHLDILKQRAQSIEDSESDEEEIDKNKISALFKNFQGDEIDVARIASQFFERGEHIDCLICELQMIN